MSTRTFIALPIGDEDQAVLEAAREALSDLADAVRWIPARNRHLTMRFLGSVDDSLLDRVKQAFGAWPVPSKPLAVPIECAGGFPPNRPSVVAVTLGDDAALKALAGQVNELLAPLGIAPERRSFRAHVTIGRFRERPPTRFPAVAATGCIAFDRIGLYASELKPGGAVHRPLALREFAPPPA